ncbi:hypothetical protein PHYPSEUDO_004258 [Phytophthora pseudosyringae]|uniref:WLGC domain-containing protein n=1 Tax=Phytophthora pseudosyringae TaxID=221518 RepID=A0A8T1VSA1_9STRA|nr:hypothetical protein PHYPSEUDO_004258 [Phytophthora pseudosyringae]
MVSKVRVHAIGHLPAKASSPRPPNALVALASTQHTSRKNEVEPFGPFALSRGSDSDGSFIAPTESRQVKDPIRVASLSFRDSFGLLGLPMVLMVFGCVAWTLWLIVLSVAPNAAANFIMETSEFDDGQFWLIPDEWSLLQFVSVAGLVVVVMFYVYVALKMLVWRSGKNALQAKLDELLAAWEAAATTNANGSLQQTFSRKAVSWSWKGYVQWKAITGIHGRNRKFWNLCLKIHDLVMLSLFLRDLLEAGTPVRIACGFAALAALNSLSCAVGILLHRFTALAEILVDSLFDFGATVIYPLTVLGYCVENFHYDRAVFAINMEVLPIGSFERRARMYANPAEIALVRISFDSLRILDYTDLFLRIGMNMAFSYRCKRIVDVLIEINRSQQSHRRTADTRQVTQQPVYFSFSSSEVKHGNAQRVVPRHVAVLFVAYSIGVLVTTHVAISTSQAVCSPHPECVVFAYRWRSTGFCPCRALVDGNPAPKTYYEWTHAVDATETVKTLAAAGTLETLQLVNRQLIVLPDELRGCRNLHLLSLINCATEEFPTWAKDFHRLQFLQVEGKVGSDNLGDFAPDLFRNMAELRYLQLGVHARMLRLPPLDGAPSLRSVIFSRLYNLVEFPALTHQTHLERLELTTSKRLASLPDLQPVTRLVHFAIFQGALLCCNGFLGTCNLTDAFCKNATCLEDSALRATPATLQVFNEFSYAVCKPHNALSQVPTLETIQMCDGVPYRQCQLPGLAPGTWVEGMCYNHRMQVLACNPDPDKIKVRRRQIQEGVGTPCNPEIEAWLGCEARELR